MRLDHALQASGKGQVFARRPGGMEAFNGIFYSVEHKRGGNPHLICKTLEARKVKISKGFGVRKVQRQAFRFHIKDSGYKVVGGRYRGGALIGVNYRPV